MARLSRVVIPGVPHHVTQRGNRRERTFFEDGDYQLYLDLLVEPALERVGDFAQFLDQDFDEAAAFAPLRKAELIGRPVGTPAWIAAMEARTGMTLAPGKRGPKPKPGGVI